MTTNVAVNVSAQIATYGFGHGHPSGTDRLAAFLPEFEASEMPARIAVLPTREATPASGFCCSTTAAPPSGAPHASPLSTAIVSSLPSSTSPP
jgi:hypothetical protein